MHIRRPKTALFVFRAIDGAEIRGKRVEPDIKNVRFLPGNGNAPPDGRAGDAEILQPALHETDNFVAPCLRLDEIRILSVKIKKRLLERGQFEKVIFFGESLGRAATVRTVVARFCVWHKCVVVDTVLSGVVTFVDVTILAAQAEK